MGKSGSGKDRVSAMGERKRSENEGRVEPGSGSTVTPHTPKGGNRSSNAGAPNAENGDH